MLPWMPLHSADRMVDADNADDLFRLFGTPSSPNRMKLLERLGMLHMFHPSNLTAHYKLDLSLQKDYVVAMYLLKAYAMEMGGGYCNFFKRGKFGAPLEQVFESTPLDRKQDLNLGPQKRFV